MHKLFAGLVLLLGLIAPGLAFQPPPEHSPASGSIALNQLPPEARDTLGLIKQGGPFPFPRDGIVFGNFERLLPRAERGYYHEYTVKTPGQRNRGARRIVAGGQPPQVYYYSDDHYQTFRRILEPQ